MMPRGLIAMTRCGGVVFQVCKLGVHVLSNFRMLAMRLRSAEILKFFIRPNRRSCARSAFASPSIRTDPISTSSLPVLLTPDAYPLI